eukprot:gene841-9090_t
MTEQIINFIIDSSKKESDLDSLKKGLENNFEKIQKNSNALLSAYSKGFLDSKKHTLGLIYIFYAKASNGVDKNFIPTFEHFLANLDQHQASKACQKFAKTVHEYTDALISDKSPQRAMKHLLNGIINFRPHSECLTPLHSDYICCCLKSMNFKVALRVLNQPIYDIEPNQTGLTPKDMLSYYYYGGMIFIGLKQFDKAFSFFDTALCVPALAINAIMVESYKKYILVSLLLFGKTTSISSTASSIVQRSMKTYCQSYYDFGEAYNKREMDKLIAIQKQHDDLFNKDNNMGLIKQCISSLTRGNIERLTDTYLTLSLSDITETGKLKSDKESENTMLRMVENGEIKALISQKESMVSFKSEEQEFYNDSTFLSLEKQIDQSIDLCKKLKSIDKNMGSSTLYIAKLSGVREEMLEQGSKSQRGGAFGGMFGMFSKH